MVTIPGYPGCGCSVLQRRLAWRDAARHAKGVSTVLVTGAAGKLGRRVVDRLVARPAVDSVVAVDMAPLPPSYETVEEHLLDLSLPGAQARLASLAKGADVFLHLAWDPKGRGNLSALRNVLAAAEAVQPAQLVHLSSATVYGAWPDNPVPLTEEAALRPNPELAYAVDKRAAEVSVGLWAEDHPEVAVAVLRPACTVGSDRHPFHYALAVGNRPLLGGEGRLVQYLHVDDLAEAVVHAWEHGLAGTFNVAPDNGVQEEVASTLQGGRAKLSLSRPVKAAMSAWRWGLWRRGVPPGAQAYATYSWVVAGDKLRRTGWQPQYTSEEALVVSDERSHWDELPPGWRRSLTVAGAATAVAVASAGGALMWRRRR
ncbi:MAG: NAD-dependent epimerase/dehydratase family protein [Acidimicrobiales bacterium]